MEKEVSNGAMLGIVLIALAAIIGLGFGIFAIAKGTASDGIVGVQDNLNQVGASAFTSYDQRIVTGTEVASAYHNFEGKPIAILVATQATKDRSGSGTSSIGDLRNGAGVKPEFMDYVSASGSGVVIKTNQTVENPDGRTVALNFINYNAILLPVEFTMKVDGSSVSLDGLINDNGTYKMSGSFKVAQGKVVTNNSIGNLSKSGMMEYVSSGSRFQANLIKDQSGTIMGIAFEQIVSR